MKNVFEGYMFDVFLELSGYLVRCESHCDLVGTVSACKMASTCSWNAPWGVEKVHTLYVVNPSMRYRSMVLPR